MTKKKKKKEIEKEKKPEKKKLTQGIIETVTESIKDNLEEYKGEMVNSIEKKVENDFNQRIEKLETRVEKDVEDFLLVKFDKMMEKFSKSGGTGSASQGSEDITDLRGHVKELMDIQEEMVSKMNQKVPEDAGIIRNQINDLGLSVSRNTKEIKRIASQLEDTRKTSRPGPELEEFRQNINGRILELEKRIETAPRGGPVEGMSEIRKDIEEKFFDINRRLEQAKEDFRGEITRIENRPVHVPMQRQEEDAGKEEKLHSRISLLEKEIYDLKKRKKRNYGAVVLE